MIIAMGSDHAGFRLKEKIKKYLKDAGYLVKDYGTNSLESCDYPQIGLKVALAVARKRATRGLLICKTGIGQAIVANKIPGIRAAVCLNLSSARYSRKHNDANVLVFGSLFLRESMAKRILSVWLKTKFEGGRHKRRISQIREIEKMFLKPKFQITNRK